MIARSYPTGQFAARAGVTVRTLRFYDSEGILRPSSVTEAGHRRYTDRDLVKLQQILALKFLGFSLEQIREIVQVKPLRIEDSLDLQRRMMVEKRRQIDTALRAIEKLQGAMAERKELDPESLIQAIKATQMEEYSDWYRRFYTEEQLKELEERAKGYTEEQALADQQAWADVIAGMKAAAARGEAPGSPAVQELAGQWMGLIQAFTRGDPGITQGLNRMWTGEWDGPFPRPYNEEEGAYIQRALEIYRGGSSSSKVR